MQAFDVRTAADLGVGHHSEERPEGVRHLLNGSADASGNTGVWTGITADPVAGLAYLAVEAPTSDFYGGKRPGDNLYSDSVVAVDLKTGKMKWYYQLVHHDIWDYDMSSPPMLMDIVVDGKPIKAVAEPTKMGMLYASIALPASRSGRFRKSRCRRPTCRRMVFPTS